MSAQTIAAICGTALGAVLAFCWGFVEGYRYRANTREGGES